MIRIILFLLIGIGSASAALDYVEYLDLSDEARRKLEKRYVKKKGDRFHLRMKTYAVQCDVSPEMTLKMAVMMDDFYKQFKSKFKGSFKNKKAPLLFVMKNYKTYAQAVNQHIGSNPPSWSAGLFTSWKGGALFGNAEHGEYAIETLKHEGAHQLLNAYLGIGIPVWFNEGTATHFESFEMDRSMENNVVSCMHLSNRVLALDRKYKGQRIPFDKLVTIDGEAWRKAKDPSYNYMSSWCAVNYLLTTKKGLPIYNKLLSAMKRDPKAGKKALSKKSIADLEKRIHEHIQTVVLPHARNVRKIEAYREANRLEETVQFSDEYLKAHPDNLEAKFYTIFMRLLKGDTIEGASKSLLALDKDDYRHPEFDYALCLAYKAEGDMRRAEKALKVQLANQPRHMAGRELMKTF